MYFKVTILTSFFAGAFAQMSIGCYPFGSPRNDMCTRFIDSFCNSVAKIQVRAGDSGSHCYNGDAVKCDFMAVNTRSMNGPPSLADCQNVLRNASKCIFGGSGRPSPNGYTFIIDPNSDSCR